MKRLCLLMMILSWICAGASAAPVWHDASEFPVYGKISDATNSRYERLPGYLEGKCRKPVWNIGRNSAGLYIRFKAKTMAIYVKWTPLFDNHMTDTGIKGLDREVINLGFSGNGLLDYEIAELMASHKDPGLFVLDYVPNPTADVIEAKGERFFRILRDAHPDVPVVFVELPNGPTMLFDKGAERIFIQKNAAQRQLFEKLKKAGEKKIYYVETGEMIGTDGEATVDGTHFTDVGMMRYVDHILPVLRKALK